MSDQNKAVVAEEAVNAAEVNPAIKADEEKTAAEKQEALVRKIAKGTLKLSTAIRAGGVDVKELAYDFDAITGWEYAEAMDCDTTAPNVFVMTSKQALCLFAKAADKVNEGIDETDIKKRIGALDAMEAMQWATLFFRVSAQIRNRHIFGA